LNEKISKVVWAESLKQSNQMLDWFEANSDLTTNTIVDSLKTIAINVLGTAAYGFSQPWTPSKNTSSQSTSQSFFNSVSLQTQFFILTALVPTRILRLPFMPERMQNLAAAKVNFPRYAQDLINAERMSHAGVSGVKSNVMAMLVQVLDQGDDMPEQKSREQKQVAMTVDEIQGNLFILSVPRLKTTANTMAYAVVLLAVYPEWQEWLIEEIDCVASQDPHELYKQTYPKLLRSLAFMVNLLIDSKTRSSLTSW
jgi:cytochrome P450